MDTALWIAQVVLAPAFGTAGTLKVSQPKTKLTPLAATGLAIEQVGAAIVHVRRGEPRFIVGNVVLIAIAAFVAWDRFGDYPL